MMDFLSTAHFSMQVRKEWALATRRFDRVSKVHLEMRDPNAKTPAGTISALRLLLFLPGFLF